MNVQNKQSKQVDDSKPRLLVQLIDMQGPTRIGGAGTFSRLQVGSEGIEEMELLEKRQVIRIQFKNGLFGCIPLANVAHYVEVNEAAQLRFKPFKQQMAETPPASIEPKPVVDDTIKL
jgi:hypothetical protein